MSAIEIIEDAGLDYRSVSGGEITISCPMCAHSGNKKKFYINDDSGLWQCKVCGEAGNKVSLAKLLGVELRDNPDYELVESEVSDLYERYISRCQRLLIDGENEKPLEWLIGHRGLDARTIEEARLGWHPGGIGLVKSLLDQWGSRYPITLIEESRLIQHGKDALGGCIVIPYISNGKIVQVRGRKLASDPDQKYLTLSGDGTGIYGVDNISAGGDVIITEGEFDSLIVNQYGRNSSREVRAIAVPGAGIAPLKLLPSIEDCKRVYVGFDPDHAGRRGADKLKDALEHKARVITLPEDGKDWTDWLPEQENPSKAIDELMREADDAERKVFSVGDAYREWNTRKDIPGIKFGYRRLDAAIYPGPQPGAVVVPLAGTGVGKTVFLANLDWAWRDMRVLHLTLENTSAELFELLRRISRFHNPGLKADQVQEHFGKLRIVDENAVSLDQISYLIEEYRDGIGDYPQVVIIDYLGYLANHSKGRSSYEQASSAVMMLKAIAKKYNLVIVSPSQVNREKKQGQAIGLSDARDSGKIGETADIVLGLTRPGRTHIEGGDIVDGDQDSEMITVDEDIRLQVLKTRSAGTGTVVHLVGSAASLAITEIDDVRGSGRVKKENMYVRDGLKYNEIMAQVEDR